MNDECKRFAEWMAVPELGKFIDWVWQLKQERDALLAAQPAPAGEREAFEREVKDQHDGGSPDLSRKPDGSYQNFYLECAWNGWQQRAAWQRTQSAGVLDAAHTGLKDLAHEYRHLLLQQRFSDNDEGDAFARHRDKQVDRIDRILLTAAPAQDVAGLVEAAKKADDALSALVRNDQPLETLVRKYGSDWSSAIDKERIELVIQIATHDKQSGEKNNS